jgi:hypothetical protein
MDFSYLSMILTGLRLQRNTESESIMSVSRNKGDWLPPEREHLNILPVILVYVKRKGYYALSSIRFAIHRIVLRNSVGSFIAKR